MPIEKVKKVVANWADEVVNPQGNYMEAFKGKPENVHPLSEAGFKKYLGLDYGKGLLPDNKDGSVRLPPKTERQITADTTFIKKRIDSNYKNKSMSGEGTEEERNYRALINADTEYLNKLREMYKTGKPIVTDEFSAWKDRKILKDGKIDNDAVSPLNILRNFTIRPNKEKGTVEYRDVYDLDKIPFLDRMYNPYEIKGTVPG